MNSNAALKDTGILAVWILVVVLLGALVWYLALPVRNRLLVQTINAYLETSGEKIRLDAHLPLQAGAAGRAASVGERFGIRKSKDTAVVFLLLNNGASALCLAQVDSRGRVDRYLPLSKNSAQILKTGLPGIGAGYVRRIELAESRLREAVK